MTTQTFADFGLARPLTDALVRANFTTPTPIQVKAIPPQMEGRDILGIAETGSGKTAAFGLPILNAILALQGRPAPKTCRALILAPTRELAVQIDQNLRVFAGGARLSTQIILGGVGRGGQVKALSRGVDVVIATPGRLTDLMDTGDIRLDETRFVVLDEADRMLDMGFIVPVRRIVAKLHPRRQSALFSATMPKEVAELAAGLLRDPVRVEAAPPATAPVRIEQRLEEVPTAAKRTRLAELLGDPEMSRAIVFARTKRGADRVAENLEKDGIDAEVIHGNKAQNARQRALTRFRMGQVRVLVATDIVARGIDVPGISHVINYDLPDEAESYVHRIGRTGRNGAFGTAITLCAPDEVAKVRAVEKITRVPLLEARAGQGVPSAKPARGRAGGDPSKQRAHKADGHRGKPAHKTAEGHHGGHGAEGKAIDPVRAARARARRPRRTSTAA